MKVCNLPEVELLEIKTAHSISELAEHTMQMLTSFNRNQSPAIGSSDTEPNAYSLELGTFDYPEYSLQLTEPG